MKFTARALPFLAALVLVIAAAPSVEAVQDSALSLEILINGQPLNEFVARDTTYVEAVRHAEYSLRLANRTGRRMAVALSVDGLNTIDARSRSAAKASKWVLDPWETVTIEGWQIGADNARKFFFTSEDKSYGAWLGTTSNLGVIEAVAYRERVPVPPRRHPIDQWQRDENTRMRSGESAAPQASGKAAPAPTEELSDDMAATGIGRKVDHRVTRVRLDLEPNPAARLRVRYEYREQLVRLGVLPSPDEERALARRERARGFDDVDFAPDPWGGR
ncbi:MAG: hypothetical protein V2I67_05930 [Thermoanaerobaculales bacterium]|jgi:hypothetical protein|nr:hypothetical protein [Thermoanaerobaculales bacterium]